MVVPSRLALAQMGQGPSPSVRFWQTGAGVDVGLGVYDGPGEGGHLLLGQGEHMEGQPLGGFDAHPGQLGEVLHKIFKGGGKVLHGKDLQ